jgi:hypothetical protein
MTNLIKDTLSYKYIMGHSERESFVFVKELYSGL